LLAKVLMTPDIGIQVPVLVYILGSNIVTTIVAGFRHIPERPRIANRQALVFGFAAGLCNTVALGSLLFFLIDGKASQVAGFEKRLANPGYVNNAKPELVAETRELLEVARDHLCLTAPVGEVCVAGSAASAHRCAVDCFCESRLEFPFYVRTSLASHDLCRDIAPVDADQFRHFISCCSRVVPTGPRPVKCSSYSRPRYAACSRAFRASSSVGS